MQFKSLVVGLCSLLFAISATSYASTATSSGDISLDPVVVDEPAPVDPDLCVPEPDVVAETFLDPATATSADLELEAMLAGDRINAAACRAACEAAGQNAQTCRLMCRGLSGATCTGLLAWCHHLIRACAKKQAEACLITHNSLCSGT